MELRVDRSGDSSYELNNRQLERISAIMNQFGANVTSLKFRGFVLPINFILELLHRAPKLESLSFTRGKEMRTVTDNASTTLQLPSLKALEINGFPGILDTINSITAGSLRSISYLHGSTESIEVPATIRTKLHIKSLTLEVRSKSDLTALCVDHLQLETLTLVRNGFDDAQFVEVLKCQSNLKELRFQSSIFCKLNGSLFRWICKNLKKLEVLDVDRLDSIEGNAFEMLGELKQLRHFRTTAGNVMFENGFQSSQFKSDSIEKFEFGLQPEFRCGELLDKVVYSLAHYLPNLTHLKMKFENYSALCFVLGHCTKIIHLSCYISDPIPDQLTQQRFPHVRTMKLFNYYRHDSRNDKRYKIMPWIVRAMPNLKSMTLSMLSGLKFDVHTMKEFVKESKSLEYLYVEWFELHRELPADDVVEIIRCLRDQLKGFYINFHEPTSQEDSNWHKIKDVLSKHFYVSGNCWISTIPCFCLHKGWQRKCRGDIYTSWFE